MKPKVILRKLLQKLNRRVAYALWIVPCLFLTGCSGIFYQPDREMVRTPSDIGLEYSAIAITSDGESTLRGWFLPAAGPVRGTILFLHGNAENISTHVGAVMWFPAEGYQVYLFDYSGYGESDGQAGISEVHADIERMIEFVSKDSRSSGHPLVLFGQSLGATMALFTASQPKFRGSFDAVIVDSPFASYRDIAREKMRSIWLTWPFSYPLGWLITNSFSPNRYVGAITIPVLILHCDQDPVVAYEHSEELCIEIGRNCSRTVVAGCGHTGALRQLDIRRQLLGFLTSAVPSGIGRSILSM